MARSHSRTVIDAIITALRAIATTSSDSFAPTIVQRHDEHRSVEGVGGSIIVRKDGTPRFRDEGSGWLVTLLVEISVNLETGEEYEDASDEIIEEAEEDVWRALRAMNWQTLQADFRGFRATTRREEDSEDPITGFRAEVEIEYKVAYDDPDIIIDL